MTVVCYCAGSICGNVVLGDADRRFHLDAELRHAPGPWSGSYDFGSFACVAQWARDRSVDHDGRVLNHGVDATPAPAAAVPPAGEATIGTGTSA